MIFDFLFKDTKLYKGTVVDLKEKYRIDELEAYDQVPTVYYDIYLHDTKTKIGTCDLRLKNNEYMYYYGNIGYNIINKYRGNHYAYEASKLLFEIAHKEFNYNELIITCSPENIASYNTILKLNGELLELVDVPKDHPLYKIGEKRKYVFKFKL